MVHLSPLERLRVIVIYNDLKDIGNTNKCHKVSQLATDKGISISESGVRKILTKWLLKSKV